MLGILKKPKHAENTQQALQIFKRNKNSIETAANGGNVEKNCDLKV